MTVGELKQKLELYQDDEEIFTGTYDDLYGTMSYHAPRLLQENVEGNYSKDNKYLYYSKFSYRSGAKKATILVIE